MRVMSVLLCQTSVLELVKDMIGCIHEMNGPTHICTTKWKQNGQIE